MFFAKQVPPGARDAYSRDAWAGILSAAMGGITLPFIIVIARMTLKASAMEVGDRRMRRSMVIPGRGMEGTGWGGGARQA